MVAGNRCGVRAARAVALFWCSALPASGSSRQGGRLGEWERGRMTAAIRGLGSESDDRVPCVGGLPSIRARCRASAVG